MSEPGVGVSEADEDDVSETGLLEVSGITVDNIL